MIHFPHAEEDFTLYSERYTLSRERIREIAQELREAHSPVTGPLADYCIGAADLLELTARVYESSRDGSLYQKSLEELQALNHQLYEDILPGQYEESYANPDYALRLLGEALGPLLCLLYTELRAAISYAFQQRLFYLVTAQELFLEIYPLLEEEAAPEEIRSAIYYYVSDYADITIEDRTLDMLSPSRDFFTSLILGSDLNDLRYLYYFGEYVSENELGTAAYLNSLSQQAIDSMAATFTQGYIRGFALYRIDLSRKSTVNIRYRLGFERIVRSEILQFREHSLDTTLYPGAVSLVHKALRRSGLVSSSPNRQYDYDHRMDDALILDKAFLDRKLAQQRHSYESHARLAAAFAGPAVMEVFGESPFSPQAKESAPQYSSRQQALKREYQAQASALTNEFIPGEETSFTIISYPIPEIGKDYAAIFQDTIRINTLDPALYEKIQTALIQALDQGDSVTVTGRNGNRTDLTVAFSPLEDPRRQTNFENCLADVNIPLGEVFTSPKLEGTNGTLHVTQVYLNELKYDNLLLTFRDGMIEEYQCQNFGTREENEKYIRQNLLNNHASLPMGEFAIGTNTTAYATGQKYQISQLLPILIAEKTGPHFAIGDTCFSHEEDLVTYNPDGKQMVAKENSFSQLRHTQPDKAYFNCHTDITIPYNELGSIVVNCRDGHRIPVIQEGRFVLPGTEELNQSLSINSL